MSSLPEGPRKEIGEGTRRIVQFSFDYARKVGRKRVTAEVGGVRFIEPVATPVGTGFRSVNVYLRQEMKNARASAPK